MRKIYGIVAAIFIISGCQSLKGGDGPRRQSLFGSLNPNSKNEAPAPNTAGGAPMGNQAALRSYGAGGAPMQAIVVPMELTNIDGNIWRSGMEPVALFNMISRLLAQRYLISNVDRRSLTIATDWDKFFIEGRLFRNRLSISVFPVGLRQTEVVIKNTVEYYSGSPNGGEAATSVVNWYPTPDITDELPRVVDSLNRQIAYLNQPTMSR